MKLVKGQPSLENGEENGGTDMRPQTPPPHFENLGVYREKMLRGSKNYLIN